MTGRLPLVLLTLLGLVTLSTAHDFIFLYGSKAPIAQMNDDDLAMFENAAKNAHQEASDGEAIGWRAPDSSSWGTITQLEAGTLDGATCRKLDIQNHARDLSGRSEMRI